MTKVEMYNAIMKVNGLTDEMVAFLKKERYATEKRNARKSTSLTKTQKENVGLKKDIITFLDGVDSATATEIGVAVGITVQRASALLRQLIAEGKVEKNTEKRVSHFSAVA